MYFELLADLPVALGRDDPYVRTVARQRPRVTQVGCDDQPADHITCQAEAIEVYQMTGEDEVTGLGAELATRIRELTGVTLAPDKIYVDREKRLAVTNVHGVVFRLERRDLRVMRPCAFCRTEQLASPSIYTRADLGHALVGWQPVCGHCPPEDEPWDW